MQLCSEGAKVPFPAAGPGQSHAGGQENSILTSEKVIDRLIIMPEEFLQKFEPVK